MSVTFRNRILITLIASIVAAVALYLVEIAVHSKLLFPLVYPGLIAFAYVWGIHSAGDGFFPTLVVWCTADALVYWPFVFGLSFLIRKKRPN